MTLDDLIRFNTAAEAFASPMIGDLLRTNITHFQIMQSQIDALSAALQKSQIEHMEDTSKMQSQIDALKVGAERWAWVRDNLYRLQELVDTAASENNFVPSRLYDDEMRNSVQRLVDEQIAKEKSGG